MLELKSKNSARPFCYGTGSENRLDGIQNCGRFGSVFCKTVSDPSDGFRTPLYFVAPGIAVDVHAANGRLFARTFLHNGSRVASNI
jgi:hypothetical protein